MLQILKILTNYYSLYLNSLERRKFFQLRKTILKLKHSRNKKKAKAKQGACTFGGV